MTVRANLRRRLFVRGSFLAMLVSSIMACSLINALDDVKSGLDADAGGEGGLPDVPADASGDVVPDAPSASAKGVIVVGGTAGVDGGALQSVLTALAPETGNELPNAREAMTVAGVQYDGLRDLWYVFQSGGSSFFPLPTDPVFLHVRTLDTNTGTWGNVQTLKVPPPVAFTHIGVLRERVVYVAYRGGSDSQFDLVTLRTSDPSNVAVVDTQPLDRPVVGLIATRSQNQNHGVVNLLRSTPCDAGLCLEVQHVTLAADTSPVIGAVVSLGPYSGSPAFGSFISGGVDLIAFKTTASASTTSLRSYDPLTVSPVGSPIEFSINDPFMKPLAVAECLGQALVTGTNQDLAVYAIPLTSTKAAARGPTAHSGQGVYYEPFTSTVLAPFSQGEGYELTALRLTVSDDGSPRLVQRQAPDWLPPSDLRPEIVATRTPLPVQCQ